MYKTSPVQVNLIPQEAELLDDPMIVEMALQPQGSLDINVKVGDDEFQKHFDKLPAVFPTARGTLAFFMSPDSLISKGTDDVDLAKKVRNITATINNPLRVARWYCKSMTIEPTSKTTSVAVISLKNSSLRRGQDFINKLLEMYNINTNNDKNEIAQKTAEFIDAIKELSVLELNDLVKACEEEFGVSAAAGVVVAAAGADGAAAEEKTEFDVELTEVGPNKVKVIKVVREITGLGLKEAKDAVDGAPKVIKEQLDKASAEDAKAKLEAEGAKVTLK